VPSLARRVIEACAGVVAVEVGLDVPAVASGILDREVDRSHGGREESLERLGPGGFLRIRLPRAVR
jgi:hypothetical protein